MHGTCTHANFSERVRMDASPFFTGSHVQLSGGASLRRIANAAVHRHAVQKYLDHHAGVDVVDIARGNDNLRNRQRMPSDRLESLLHLPEMSASTTNSRRRGSGIRPYHTQDISMPPPPHVVALSNVLDTAQSYHTTKTRQMVPPGALYFPTPNVDTS